MCAFSGPSPPDRSRRGYDVIWSIRDVTVGSDEELASERSIIICVAVKEALKIGRVSGQLTSLTP